MSEKVTQVQIRTVSVGPMDNRAYLLSSHEASSAGQGSTGQASAAQAGAGPSSSHLLIDAAAEPERLLELLTAAGANPSDLATVVTTHRHRDHTGALVEVLAVTGARHLAGADDADHLPAPVDRRLAHGDRVSLGPVELEVIALRGHTPGSVALLLPAADHEPAHLFTGDSLFPGGPGRTGTPTTFASLMDDLEARVFDVLGDEVVVHPGHGEPTTLGAERPHLPAWRARGW